MTLVWKYSFYLEFLIIFFEEIHKNNIKSLKKLWLNADWIPDKHFAKFFTKTAQMCTRLSAECIECNARVEKN